VSSDSLRVLALTRYDRLGASSRIRFLQYLPYLSDAQITVTASPFFPSSYTHALQDGRRLVTPIPGYYLKRIFRMVTYRTPDIIWVEKELFPWVPLWLERFFIHSKVPLVVDYDDAVFHRYDNHKNFLIKSLLAEKHPWLMKRASLVIVGSSYIEEFAKNNGARAVTLLPSVVALSQYRLKRQSVSVPNLRVPCVGWIGQASTAAFLKPLVRLLNRFQQEGLLQFKTIGIDPSVHDLPFNGAPWSEETEVDLISELDIGIMPLSDGPFERGKCGYKLIQYMACGLPVVASPVGENKKIVDHGINGFLADTEAEWSQALLNLIGNPSLRARMGRAGRQKVEQHYSTEAIAPRLAGVLRNVVSI
jgi:glycosyltransferase involved in cell wall biosynthesis